MTKKLKVVFSVLLMLLLLLICDYKAKAEWDDSNAVWSGYEGGNLIRQGGFNQIDGLKAEDKYDTMSLESYLNKSGYILVSSDSKSVSNEDYELILPYLPYQEYIDKKSNFLWNNYKLYVYKPCYTDLITSIKSETEVSQTTIQEIRISSVMVNYYEWYQKERIGKFVNEINERIPEWYKNTGYILIKSPVSAEITFELEYEKTLTQVYVDEGEPLLLKMKAGMYSIKKINATNIKDNEELIYNNNVNVLDTQTKEEPYVLDLTELTQKHNIQSLKKLDNKTDNLNSFFEEETIIEKEKEEEVKEGTPIIKVLLVSFFVGLIVFILLLLYIKKNKNERK